MNQLNAWIAKAEEINEKDYTEESINHLQNVLAEAKTLANAEDSTVSDLMEASKQLENAINSLEKALDYSALLKTIEKAEQIVENLDAYDPSSVEGFENKLAHAKKVVENASNQQEIDDVREMLEKAIADVKEKTVNPEQPDKPENPDKPSKPETPEKPSKQEKPAKPGNKKEPGKVTTGLQTNTGILMVAGTLALAGLGVCVALERRKKY